MSIKLSVWMHDRRAQWLTAVVAMLLIGSLLPDPLRWLPYLRALDWWFWPIFLLLQWGCALFMVPSLPLVMLAALVFPEQAIKVLGMALVGVAGSAALIYRWADFLGFAKLFESDSRTARARALIQRYGAGVLALWALVPFLPTDLGCYLAASAKMRFSTYLAATVLGESLLCASIIWGVPGALSATGLL